MENRCTVMESYQMPRSASFEMSTWKQTKTGINEGPAARVEVASWPAPDPNKLLRSSKFEHGRCKKGMVDAGVRRSAAQGSNPDQVHHSGLSCRHSVIHKHRVYEYQSIAKTHTNLWCNENNTPTQERMQMRMSFLSGRKVASKSTVCHRCEHKTG